MPSLPGFRQAKNIRSYERIFIDKGTCSRDNMITMKKISLKEKKRCILAFVGMLGFLFLYIFILQSLAGQHHNISSEKREVNVQFDLSMKRKKQESPGEQASGEVQAGKLEKISPVKVMFVGDLMLDRYNRQLLEKNGLGWFLKEVGGIVESNDFNVANLEGVISDNGSFYESGDLWDESILRFTFDPEKSLGLLEKNNFNLVNLGNNHTDDFDADGLGQTLANLDGSNVGYFGDVSGKDINSRIFEKNGMEIGFVSYNEFGGETVSQVIKRVEDFRNKVDFLVVYTHWGKEYELTENESQKQKAHAFIDAGADVVIGSHPHVVQPIEIYKNKAIFYSLGNFIFDQYFSEDTKNMLALAMTVSEKDISFRLIPLYLQPNGQLVLADEGKKNLLLERIARSSDEVDQGVITAGSFNLNR